MAPPVLVGNDVVDLSNPRVRGKAGDERFVSRILDASERPALSARTDPDLELWCLWAAKEAAYKVVAKMRKRPPVFGHAAFRVAWTCRGMARLGDESTVRRGVVSCENVETPVEVRHEFGVLHAVAILGGRIDLLYEIVAGRRRLAEIAHYGQETADRLRDLLSPREAEAASSSVSVAVRIDARSAMAHAMDVDDARLEIVRHPGLGERKPPMVLLDGSEAPADVSLSHDGPWIAWAFWAGPAGSG
ncbi:MAG: 4'-phosphopantetheinyl transferase superfamily protein [Gemmatimonadota bacterium]